MSDTSQHDASTHHPTPHGKAGLAALVVAAVGVVFGDIGTSPLYTIQEMFSPHYGLTPDPHTVKGLLSLGFWSLILVVTLKYVLVIMRADNEGEGGIMALTALAQRSLKSGSRLSYLVGILGIFGASLFFGDGMITPPITVLGAVEGLEVVSPVFKQWVLPISLVMLTALFAFQRFGTSKVGKAFGPIMITWFVVIAGFGVWNIAQHPIVLRALNPYWAWLFFTTHDWHAVLILGAVVLTVTGGEALYADMGHFGKQPIRWGWFGFVLPALVLNYFGQGAVLLENPAAVESPFFMSMPGWAQIPMTVLATAYGLSVTGTMLIDTLLLAIVAYTRWPDTRKWVLPLCAMFLLIDVAFLFANGAKLMSGIGAWVPLFIGITAFTLMRTWRRGRELLHAEIRKEGIQLDSFLPGLMLSPPVRVSGTAVFMTADKGVVPHALLHNLKHNKVLHEHNVLLTVETLNVPYASKGERLKIASIGDDFYRVVIKYGFMETPDVPQALMRSCDQCDLVFDPMDTTYFASRETIVAGRHRGMPIWRDKLFAVMHRNAASATGFFRIPGNRLVELGAQVEI